MTPVEMLRQIFGETDTEEPLPQTPPNTTPIFQLAAEMPEFAEELRVLLAEQGETALAESVADLWAFDRCRCEAEYCATIYTIPKPEGAFPGRGGLSIFPKAGGAIYIDTSDGRIACIEALYQPEIRERLMELLP